MSTVDIIRLIPALLSPLIGALALATVIWAIRSVRQVNAQIARMQAEHQALHVEHLRLLQATQKARLGPGVRSRYLDLIEDQLRAYGEEP